MTEPYYQDERVTVHAGDCLDVLATLPDASVDSVCTDPPYALGFMGKDWDTYGEDVGRGAQARKQRASEVTPTGKGHSTSAGPYLASGVDSLRAAGRPFQAWCELWAAECLRVLKPGGHMLAFGGTRTSHRLACAIEDAGFEIRDSIAWLYGSGFSKSWNFNTMFTGEWCDCSGGFALPYNHAGNTNLPRVREDVYASAVARGESQDAVLFPPVQRRGEGPGVGQARAQGPRSLDATERGGPTRTDDRRDESCVAGRLVHRTREGLPDDSDAGSSEGAGERLRRGAPSRDGVTDRAAGDAARGSASLERGPGGQPTGEPEAVPRSHESLDDGALRDGPVCSRCGGLDPVYKGFGTGIKPAHEPIVVARKPLAGTVAANVLEHGTGTLNIDGCRVEHDDRINPSGPNAGALSEWHAAEGRKPRESEWYVNPAHPAGRWPANVVLDESQAAALDEQTGILTSGVLAEHHQRHTAGGNGKTLGRMDGIVGQSFGDSGGASRFFYVAKADSAERPRVNGTAHPTVKPLALMRWLVRLVTPPGGVVLDPFAGSGTTVEACLLEGLRCIAIEREADYLPLITSRLRQGVLDFGEVS